MEDATRRRHRRLPLDVPVRMASIDAEVDPGTGGRYFRVDDELRCANLSPAGAFLRTLDPPARGQHLLLEFQLEAGERVQATARVAWSRRVLDPAARDDAGVGVEFEPRARAAFARALARRAQGRRSRSG